MNKQPEKNFSHEFELSFFCLVTQRIRGFELDRKTKMQNNSTQHKCKWINAKRTSTNAFGVKQMLIRS